MQTEFLDRWKDTREKLEAKYSASYVKLLMHTRYGTMTTDEDEERYKYRILDQFTKMAGKETIFSTEPSFDSVVEYECMIVTNNKYQLYLRYSVIHEHADEFDIDVKKMRLNRDEIDKYIDENSPGFKVLYTTPHIYESLYEIKPCWNHGLYVKYDKKLFRRGLNAGGWPTPPWFDIHIANREWCISQWKNSKGGN